MDVNEDRQSATLISTTPQAGNFSNIGLIVDDGRGGSASLIFSISIEDNAAEVSPEEVQEQVQPLNDPQQTETTNDSNGGGGSLSLLMLLLSAVATCTCRRRRRVS